MKRKEYRKETYRGYSINCGPTKPCYSAILKNLLQIIDFSREKYARPVGFHIRYRLRDSVDGRVVTGKLKKYFSNSSRYRKPSNTFNPYWLKVSELDPDQDGWHEHIALVIDRKKAKKGSIHVFFADLMKKGYLENYIIIDNENPAYKEGVCLKSEKGIAHYFRWISYIAKTRTKEFTPQTHSYSRLA